MHFTSFEKLLASGRDALKGDPVALIFVEDEVEIDTTLRHHLQTGFRSVIAFMPASFDLAEDLVDTVVRVDHDCSTDASYIEVINRLMDVTPEGTWLYFCFNAEYLFFPFCEHRSVGEMLAFHTEERRDGVLTYVVDLYAHDLRQHDNAVSLDHACIDRTGYYALARPDPSNHNHPKERQLDFFGGLRWRFEEHIPTERRKIDRISLFRATKGLRMREDHTFSDEEYNTYACPWHNNITASLVSFRTAKALKTNPGSRYDIKSFVWHNTVPFEWHSRQLLDLGLMEPGQWF